MRDYSKVSPKLWRSRRFSQLPDDARMFYMFLLTCEHQTSAGCLRLPEAYAAADLNWQPERLGGARAPLIPEMIAYDGATDEYFILRWFRHNPPTNSKHLKGVKRLISEVDSDTVREVAEAELTDQQAVPEGAENVVPWETDNRLVSALNKRGRG